MVYIVRFRTITGQTYELPVDETMQISQLKHIVVDGYLKKPASLTLIYLGKVLKDSSTIHDNGISHGSTVNMIVKEPSSPSVVSNNHNSITDNFDQPTNLGIIQSRPAPAPAPAPAIEPWNMDNVDQIISQFTARDFNNLAQLVEMGFDPTLSLYIYFSCQRNLQMAVTLLMNM